MSERSGEESGTDDSFVDSRSDGDLTESESSGTDVEYESSTTDMEDSDSDETVSSDETLSEEPNEDVCGWCERELDAHYRYRKGRWLCHACSLEAEEMRHEVYHP